MASVDWVCDPGRLARYPHKLSASGGFSSAVLEALIRMRRGLDDSIIRFDSGYMLARAVPPENTLDFIAMTDFIDDNSKV